MSTLPNSSSSSFPSSSSSTTTTTRAPWIPDSASSTCMQCGTPFTFFRRRHHCRQCGLLLCNPCTPIREIARGYMTKVRVCVICARHLKGLKTSPIPKTIPIPRNATPAPTPSATTIDVLPPPAPQPVITSASTTSTSTTTIPSTSTTVLAGSVLIREISTHTEMSPITFTMIDAMELFNRLSGFGSLLLIDIRPTEAYREGHIPRALSIPIDEKEQLSLDDIDSRLDMMSRRIFRSRTRHHVILYANHEIHAGGYHTAHLLHQEGRIATIAMLKGGWDGWDERYPFVACRYEKKEGEKHTHRPPFPWYPNEILDNFLYLGSNVDAQNDQHLKDLGITHILNVGSECENYFPDKFIYHRLIFKDEATHDITPYFAITNKFIQEARAANGRVFVHCYHGISRSVSMVIAFLMVDRKWTLKQSYDYVRLHRKQAFPNVGFWRHLSTLESSLHGSTTVSDCVDLVQLQHEADSRRRRSVEHVASIILSRRSSRTSSRSDSGANTARSGGDTDRSHTSEASVICTADSAHASEDETSEPESEDEEPKLLSPSHLVPLRPPPSEQPHHKKSTSTDTTASTSTSTSTSISTSTSTSTDSTSIPHVVSLKTFLASIPSPSDEIKVEDTSSSHTILSPNTLLVESIQLQAVRAIEPVPIPISHLPYKPYAAVAAPPSYADKVRPPTYAEKIRKTSK